MRVLHPPPPDWERRRVRNDDSVVLEIVYRDVAILLTGDISADVEREILPRLTRAQTRILKVAHHGSRTSSSLELLDGWRPQIAVISAGRGNTFGHPATEVLQRLEAIGATVLRTDLHGQISLETDGERGLGDGFPRTLATRNTKGLATKNTKVKKGVATKDTKVTKGLATKDTKVTKGSATKDTKARSSNLTQRVRGEIWRC